MSNRAQRRHPADEDRIATQKAQQSRLHTIRQQLVQIAVEQARDSRWTVGAELDEVVEMIDDLLLVYADPITAQSLAKSYRKEATDVVAWDVIE